MDPVSFRSATNIANITVSLGESGSFWNEATACDVQLYAVTGLETNSGHSDKKERSSGFRVSVSQATMKTFLGSLLVSAMQAIETGFRAYFIFSERDAQTLASAYGFPSPEIEDLQDSRPYEAGSTVSIPRKMKLPQRLTPPYCPIPPGMHPELIGLTLGAALRKRHHM